jgi:hypothetical protein
MIGLIVRHPPIVVILEVDCSAEDGPIPRHHFIEAARLEGDMMQRGFDDRHCWPPKTFSTFIAQLIAGYQALALRGSAPYRTRAPSVELPMSALVQKRTSRLEISMSALPTKADIDQRNCHVRFVSKADISSVWNVTGLGRCA